jgi:predicted transcriptional regulator
MDYATDLVALRDLVAGSAGVKTRYLRLPREAMRELGPAAQTLAAFLTVQRPEIYFPRERYVEISRLPLRTVARHIHKLVANGWLVSHGQQGRRTVTYTLGPKTIKHCEPFALLPDWAAADPASWSVRACFAVLWSRYRVLTTDAAMMGDQDMEGYGIEFMSLSSLASHSGLNIKHARSARNQLLDRGLLAADETDGRVSLNGEAQIPADVTNLWQIDVRSCARSPAGGASP